MFRKYNFSNYWIDWTITHGFFKRLFYFKHAAHNKNVFTKVKLFLGTMKRRCQDNGFVLVDFIAKGSFPCNVPRTFYNDKTLSNIWGKTQSQSQKIVYLLFRIVNFAIAFTNFFSRNNFFWVFFNICMRILHGIKTNFKFLFKIDNWFFYKN